MGAKNSYLTSNRHRTSVRIRGQILYLQRDIPPCSNQQIAGSCEQVESRPSRDTGHVFVGRQQEMVRLNAALDGVRAGHGRLVVLAGEPGIGKTRIAQELASLAEEQGAQVFWGRCYEEEGGLHSGPGSRRSGLTSNRPM